MKTERKPRNAESEERVETERSDPSSKNSRDEIEAAQNLKCCRPPRTASHRIANVHSYRRIAFSAKSPPSPPSIVIRAPAGTPPSRRRGDIRRSKRQRANAIYTRLNGMSRRNCWYVARLLLVLHDLDLLLVGDQLVVALGREVHGGRGDGAAGQDEEGPRGGDEGPRGVEVPTIEEALVVVVKVGLDVLGWLGLCLCLGCEGGGETYHYGHARHLHDT
jgi:hypothetical protein